MDMVLLGDLWGQRPCLPAQTGSYPMILCRLSLYDEVGFIPGPEEQKTSVPGEPPGFSCKKKGLSHPFQPTRGGT